MKNTHMRRGAKAGHVSYLGDTDIGEEANIGAGTVVANYDGQRKHRTVIGKGAFTGSNSTLVAPLEVGEGAYIAAGSTVNKNIPPDALAIARARQENKEGYVKRLRSRGS
jgi:bifunctional UDP-N-acetylglucosamine pyrophosphorylase/glucosamine-1-phosphate N-acetyltransferase